MRRSPLACLASIPPSYRRWLLSETKTVSAYNSFSQCSRCLSPSNDPHKSREEQTTSLGERTAGHPPATPDLPFRFETGFALFAKRTPRPFPPPFLSPPSGSFSDPLSTHHQSRDRRAFVNGEIIQGWTNGDDAIYAGDFFICANDGVGAWASRPRGHAGLWARLILHYWVAGMNADMEKRLGSPEEWYQPDPLRYLQDAYEKTIKATTISKGKSEGADTKDPKGEDGVGWLGTTTVAGAQLFMKRDTQSGKAGGDVMPMLYVTNLGDSQVMVIRPRKQEMVYKSTEQWHWFDCPRQLGTNSPDTPKQNAVVDKVDIEEGDVVLAMSDGVIDNLWAHEIVENVTESVKKWEAGEGGQAGGDRTGGANGGMTFVAESLMGAAKAIAIDPFAESPFMEHAIEEGLPGEGGKLDDISVVAALCKRNDTT